MVHYSLPVTLMNEREKTKRTVYESEFDTWNVVDDSHKGDKLFLRTTIFGLLAKPPPRVKFAITYRKSVGAISSTSPSGDIGSWARLPTLITITEKINGRRQSAIYDALL